MNSNAVFAILGLLFFGHDHSLHGFRLGAPMRSSRGHSLGAARQDIDIDAVAVESISIPCNGLPEEVATATATTSTRRIALQTMASSLPTAAITLSLSPALAAANENDTTTTISISKPIPSTTIIDDSNTKISVPLEYIPALNAYVIHYYLFGERFGAIVDTGSPFLTAPATCSKWSYKYKWGCYHPELTYDSGYANTVEGFDNNQGPVVWRKAGFSFDEEIMEPRNLTFGVFGPDLLDGPGGVFFGLIKQTDKWIRPSFLGQTGYTSFCVDLRRQNTTSATMTPTETTTTSQSQSQPQLVLSKQSMIDNDDYIPLTRELNRRYKAPVVHYTAKAMSFVVNGLSLKIDKKTPTLVIFDTGLSGMAVSSELFDGRNLQARKNREKSLWGQVTIEFETKAGKLVELSAKKPITTPLGKDTPWTKFKGNLIVLGLAFLDGNAMTIDVDDGKLRIMK